MGVDVDEAGRHQPAARVDLFLALGGDLADFGDLAAGDCDIGFIELAAVAIGDGAAADHEVWGRGHGVSSRGCFLIVRHHRRPHRAVNQRR
jgi:hypothetical protein